MLRAALPLTRRAVLSPVGHNGINRLASSQARGFADIKQPILTAKSSTGDPSPPVLPGSQSKTAPIIPPPPPGKIIPPGTTSPSVPSVSRGIPPANVPLTPPPPSAAKIQTTTPTGINATSSAPLPPPPPPKKKPRRFRRFLLTLILLTGLGFGGGVWYSLISDNFHDFFTEYIPFGEDAVLYFEEREFRKRFPNVLNSTPSRDSGARVTIPGKSGISPKLAVTESDLETKGRHMSALDDNKPVETGKTPKPEAPSTATQKVEAVKKPAPESKAKSKQETIPAKATSAPAAAPPEPATSTTTKSSNKTKKLPEVDEPSVYIPLTRIDPLKINNADEPVVQDLVKILNDIILVVNADNSTGRFNSTVAKAKQELSQVGRRIMEMKSDANKAADEKVKSTQAEFDDAARELVRRLEEEMRDQESRWREEFESERQRISQAYEDRLKTETELTKEVSEQRVRNQLLEQVVALKKDFASGVKDQVETERNGRLARLSELSTSIDELEKLTAEWNTVIDANLKTQHLQVAVEAVRSSLERADRPRPFIKELAALKEIAADDPIVSSAIASINPISYQRGVPTSAQLVDRFRRVAHEVRKASLLPEDAGIASHASSYLLSRIMFKKQGRAIGDDAESILTRTETLLEEGNLDEATREMNTLQGWAKTLSRDWLGEARRVLEVRQAMDAISTEARLQSLKVD